MKTWKGLSPLAREALTIIWDCETDLGRKLSAAERRDLLKDNTPWHTDVVAAVVDELKTGNN